MSNWRRLAGKSGLDMHALCQARGGIILVSSVKNISESVQYGNMKCNPVDIVLKVYKFLKTFIFSN